MPCKIKRCLDDEDNNENDYEASQPYNYHIPVSALKHVQHQGYNFTTEMITRDNIYADTGIKFWKWKERRD